MKRESLLRLRSRALWFCVLHLLSASSTGMVKLTVPRICQICELPDAHSPGLEAYKMIPDLIALWPQGRHSVHWGESVLTVWSRKSAVDDDAQKVFDYWKVLLKKSHTTRLNDKRRKAITARLREGYSADDLCLAILGMTRSPHHMGESGPTYNDVWNACRSQEHVDRFITLARTKDVDSGDWLKRHVES